MHQSKDVLRRNRIVSTTSTGFVNPLDGIFHLGFDITTLHAVVIILKSFFFQVVKLSRYLALDTVDDTTRPNGISFIILGFLTEDIFSDLANHGGTDLICDPEFLIDFTCSILDMTSCCF